MLVVVLVRNGLPGKLGRGVVRGIAAQSIRRHAELFERIGQDFFIGPTLDLAGRERVPADHGWSLAQHDSDLVRRQRAAVEIAEVTKRAGRSRGHDTMAEIVLASRVELDVGGQRVAILVEESDQAAVMVEMAVADDERVDFVASAPTSSKLFSKASGVYP